MALPARQPPSLRWTDIYLELGLIHLRAKLAASCRSSLGDRIRRLRESARITQEELARAAGIGRVTLVRIENGDRSPRYETLTALAKVLGHAAADLLA